MISQSILKTLKSGLLVEEMLEVSVHISKMVVKYWFKFDYVWPLFNLLAYLKAQPIAIKATWSYSVTGSWLSVFFARASEKL